MPETLKQSLITTKIGNYREELTSREIEIFEAIAGPELEYHGYCLENPRLEKRSLAGKLWSDFCETYSAIQIRFNYKARLMRELRFEIQRIWRQLSR